MGSVQAAAVAASECTVVLGGSGQVGALFAGLLRRYGPVVVVDVVPPSDGGAWVDSDAIAPTSACLAALREADVVVVALPERTAVAAIRTCAEALRPGTLVVDTLSVKRSVAACLAEVAATRDVEACGVNPMFAPALGFAGRAVAVVRIAAGPRTATLLSRIAGAGARVVEVSPDAHDRATAVLQAATHAAVLAFGQVVAAHSGDVGVLVDLAPPPHLTMLALLARITGGNPEVYWDIQCGNPYAESARRALAIAVADLDGVLTTQRQEIFAEWLRRIDERLGGDADLLREHCRNLFAVPLPADRSDGPH